MQAVATVGSLAEHRPLETRTLLALCILATAAVLGALGDALLRASPWGFNLLLWTSALAGSATLLARGLDAGRLTREWPLLGLAVLFAAGAAWRDSLTLKTLDGGAIALLLGMAAWRGHGGNPLTGHLTGYVRELSRFAIQSGFGAALVVFQDVGWKRLPHRRWLKLLASVLVGTALAVPVLLVFGGLLSAADAAFSKLLRDLFDIDLAKVIEHLLVSGFCAWVVCGSLRALLLARSPAAGLPPRIEPSFSDAAPIRSAMPGGSGPALPPPLPAPAFGLGAVEIGIVLGSLNLLFLAFIFVQVHYFFGGAARVEVVPGLTYAEYARRGFFELVTVAGLVLPLLLFADWLQRGRPRRTVFRVLATALVGLLFVIMASAVQRMRLYQAEFGLTELRFYATAFMGGLAVVFVWFLATVLRGRRERFTWGALVAGLAGIVALHVVNPDGWIAQTNLRRALEGKSLDVRYLTSLSADSVPRIVATLPELEAATTQEVAMRLLKRWPARQFADWRTLSLSRLRAEHALSLIASPSTPARPERE
jgi:hypothetical protein